LGFLHLAVNLGMLLVFVRSVNTLAEQTQILDAQRVADLQTLSLKSIMYIAGNIVLFLFLWPCFVIYPFNLRIAEVGGLCVGLWVPGGWVWVGGLMWVLGGGCLCVSVSVGVLNTPPDCFSSSPLPRMAFNPNPIQFDPTGPNPPISPFVSPQQTTVIFHLALLILLQLCFNVRTTVSRRSQQGIIDAYESNGAGEGTPSLAMWGGAAGVGGPMKGESHARGCCRHAPRWIDRSMDKSSNGPTPRPLQPTNEPIEYFRIHTHTPWRAGDAGLEMMLPPIQAEGGGPFQQRPQAVAGGGGGAHPLPTGPSHEETEEEDREEEESKVNASFDAHPQTPPRAPLSPVEEDYSPRPGERRSRRRRRWALWELPDVTRVSC
jgi:hypothetical protein